MFRPEPPSGTAWLELGASPGGMTSELLKRKYKVTAVDRAPLDARLAREKGLQFTKADIAWFVPEVGAKFGAMLCDMNGDPREAMKQVVRLSVFLKPGGIVIFTLKTTGAETMDRIETLERGILETAEKAGLRLIVETHLTYNRQEFTLFFERRKG